MGIRVKHNSGGLLFECEGNLSLERPFLVSNMVGLILHGEGIRKWEGWVKTFSRPSQLLTRKPWERV